MRSGLACRCWRLGAGGAGPAEVADSLCINGNIYTVDEDFSTATTMAVKGTASCMWATSRCGDCLCGCGNWITDLGGKTVLPGLIGDICMSAIWGKTT
ncbi:MAG: hypothetical protein ACLTYN_17465 [Dysosmobacter welbionis]